MDPEVWEPSFHTEKMTFRGSLGENQIYGACFEMLFQRSNATDSNVQEFLFTFIKTTKNVTEGFMLVNKFIIE